MPEPGWTHVAQGLSSFFICCQLFAIFDDFSKCLSAFGAIYFEKSSKILCKKWRKALSNLRSAHYSRPGHFQKPETRLLKTRPITDSTMYYLHKNIDNSKINDVCRFTVTCILSSGSRIWTSSMLSPSTMLLLSWSISTEISKNRQLRPVIGTNECKGLVGIGKPGSLFISRPFEVVLRPRRSILLRRLHHHEASNYTLN